MAVTQSNLASLEGGAPLDRPASPVGNAHARQISNKNTMTSGSGDNGVLLIDYNPHSVNADSALGGPNSEHDLLPSALDVRHTQVPAVSHNYKTSCDHIMDQDAQTNDYNNLPGAQLPLSAAGCMNVPVQQFSQLTVGTTNIEYAEGVNGYVSALNARPCTRHSRSSDSWFHDTSVTHGASETSTPNRDSLASGIAEASFDLISQGEFAIATTALKNSGESKGKGKGKATQGIYTSSSSASSGTRFSANHTSNDHIEAKIETKSDSANGSSKAPGSNASSSNASDSKDSLVPPHLRGRSNGVQVQRPVREPIAPGPSQGIVPPNNFKCGAPASSQANGRRGLSFVTRPVFNTGFNGADAVCQPAAYQQHPGPAPNSNQAFGMFQGNGLIPCNSTIHQAPVSTRPPAAVASFGSAQPAGAAANLAGAIAGQGSISFVPAGTFRPMNAVTRPFHRPDLDSQRELKLRLGISPNYAGDATIARNQSAQIPDSQNVAFWITNLPPNVTHCQLLGQLLGQIRGMGRVWACVISPPGREHATAAAKLVFFELAAAQKFYAHCSNPRRRLIVGGYVAHVCLNRTKKAEEDIGGNRSRVVVIMGDPSFVNSGTLLQWFRSHFEYEIDEIITHVLNKEMGHIEIRFGSWRSQAESCRQAIKTVYPPGGPQSPVWVFRYGTDPCSI
ncbi:hypothetical protein LZ30DRAFT_587992 [Colletotrichum cereale]|nr:hypothetical protein LZ30DRAFT_587992 [Colletotrichum cereale]